MRLRLLRDFFSSVRRLGPSLAIIVLIVTGCSSSTPVLTSPAPTPSAVASTAAATPSAVPSAGASASAVASATPPPPSPGPSAAVAYLAAATTLNAALDKLNAKQPANPTLAQWRAFGAGIAKAMLTFQTKLRLITFAQPTAGLVTLHLDQRARVRAGS